MTQGEKLLTIAVPSYNAEAYLNKCLSSFATAPEHVLAQLEIIVINDGSTDGTAAIATEFCIRYPQSFSLLTKENGGHGSGINAAARVASGVYFRVVDADDWVITAHLEGYLKLLSTCNADVVVTAFHRVDMNTGKKNLVELPIELCDQLLKLEDLLGKFAHVKNSFTIHGVTYKLRKYIESCSVLSEKIFYEDNEFVTLPFSHIETVFLSQLVVYQYLVGNANQSVAAQNQVKRLCQLEQVFWRIGAFWGKLSVSAVRCYVTEKLADLAFAYGAVCLLKNPDRRAGKQAAQAFLQRLQREAPEVAQRASRRLACLRVLHTLHVHEALLDTLLESSLYQWGRNLLRK